MWLFLLSLIPLIIGPIVVRGLQKLPFMARALDGFILISVGGIIFLHILPEAIGQGGILAVIAALLGLLLPTLFERHLKTPSQSGRQVALSLALVALAIHGMLDGVALAAGEIDADHGTLLALAVVMHRIPVALAVWWLALPKFGFKGALIIVTILIVTTTASFGLSVHWQALFTGNLWYVLQALLVGTLIHVLGHQSIGPAAPRTTHKLQISSTVGAAIAVGLLLMLGHFEEAQEAEHAHSHAHAHGHTAGSTFLALALESAPPLLIGFALAGLMRAFFADRLGAWMNRGGTIVQTLKGAVAGMPLNICSCAIPPKYQDLRGSKVSGSAALAFLTSAPEVGIATVLLSLTLLGTTFGLVRFALAVGLGLIIGLVIGRLTRNAAPADDDHHDTPAPSRTLRERIQDGVAFGFGDIVDRTIPWVLAGLGIAALLDGLLDPHSLEGISGSLQPLIAAAVAIPIFVCATGSTPFVALLMHKGLLPGAALAFLLIGPSTNANTWRTLAELHGKKVATLFVLCSAAVVLAFGYTLNAVSSGQFNQPLHELHHKEYGYVAWASLTALAVITLLSLLRQGVPGFISRVMSLHGHHHHHHHHHTVSDGCSCKDVEASSN